MTLWFLFQPWMVATQVISAMGGPLIPYHPFLDYWFRVIAGSFGLIGGFFFVVAWRFERFRVLIPWIGGFHLVLGGIASVASLMNGMSPSDHPTLVAEIVFLWLIGAVLFFADSFSSGRRCSV